MVFADVSGYTALSERLGKMGRSGSEQVTAAISNCFGGLIDAVLDADGDVLRFGGDALFVIFTGGDNVERAVRAAAAMQTSIGRLAAVAAPGGSVRLRQSIGVHVGDVFVHTWSGSWTEVIPFGPAVSEVLRCESVASAGEIVVSAQVLDRSSFRPEQVVRRPDGRGRLIRRNMEVRLGGRRGPRVTPDQRDTAPDVAALLPPTLREALATRAGITPEHRSSAIGFVSVAGLDQLVADPMAVAALLDPLLLALDRVGGELGVTMLASDVAADGVKLILAAGVPYARADHGDRMVAAVLAALEQCDPRTTRAGAHLGLVFAGDVGHPARRTYTVMGDTVNVAARLASVAPPGALLASETIAATLASGTAMVWQQPRFVKGKRQPIRTAIVGGAALSASTDELLQRADGERLHGRVGIIDRLVALLRTQPVLQIAGVRGLGRTTVATAITEQWQDESVVVATTIADGAAPLRLAQRAIEALGGPAAWATAASVLGSGRAGEDPAVAGGDATARLADHLIACWPMGTLLVIDDVDRADEATIAVISAAASSLRIADHGRRLLVVTQRPLDRFGEDVVELEPLDRTSLRQVVIDGAKRPLADADVESVMALAGGNPSFALQLSRLDADVHLPLSMEAVVATRIDRLTAAQRQALRLVATLGAEVPRRAVESLLGSDVAEQIDAIAAADDPLVAVSSSPEPGFAFDDEAVRAVAAAGLSVARARDVHVAMAGWLERQATVNVDEIAAHWCASGQADGIMRWARLAAARARRIGATHAATRWMQAVLDAAERGERPPDDRRAAARELAAVARLASLLDIEAAALAAEQRACEPSAWSHVQVARAANARRRGELRAAASLLARAARQETGRSEVLDAEIAVERAWQAVWRGDWRLGLRLGEIAVSASLAADHAASEHESWTLIAQARQVLAVGDHDQASEAALRAARRSRDTRAIAVANVNRAMIDDNRGRWKPAMRGYLRSVEMFDRCGEVVGAAHVRLAIASILIELGDVDAAEAQARDAARVLAAAGVAPDSLSAAESIAVQARFRRGGLRAEEIERQLQLQAIRTQVVRRADEEVGAFQQAREIETLLLAGRPAEAARLAEELIDRTARYDANHLAPAMARRLFACSLAGLGRIDEAVDVAQTALDRATTHGVPSEQVALSSLLMALGAPRRSGRSGRPAGFRRLGLVSQPWLWQGSTHLGSTRADADDLDIAGGGDRPGE